MKASYKILLFITIVFSALSCGKKFLDEPPRKVTIQDLLTNPTDGAQRLIAAVYSKLYDWSQHSFSWNGVSSITSDDAEKGSDPGDTGADKHELDNWTFNPSSISFFERWESNFLGGKIEFIGTEGVDVHEASKAIRVRQYLYDIESYCKQNTKDSDATAQSTEQNRFQ